jgi:hypothetical protein
MAKEITPIPTSNMETPLRVAFDLMVFIGQREEHEDSSTEDSRKYREYWLTLYRQCRKATVGGRPAPLNEVLDQEN